MQEERKQKIVFSRFPIDIKYLTDIPEYEIWEDSLTYCTCDEQSIDECQICKNRYIYSAGCAYKALSKKGFTHKSNCSVFEMILKEFLEYKFIMGEI